MARPDIGAAIFLGSSPPVALRAPSSNEPKKIAKRQPQTNQKNQPALHWPTQQPIDTLNVAILQPLQAHT